MTELSVRVTHILEEADGIRSFTLEPLDGGLLPAFAPGSHIVMDCDR